MDTTATSCGRSPTTTAGRPWPPTGTTFARTRSGMSTASTSWRSRSATAVDRSSGLPRQHRLRLGHLRHALAGGVIEVGLDHDGPAADMQGLGPPLDGAPPPPPQ